MIAEHIIVPDEEIEEEEYFGKPDLSFALDDGIMDLAWPNTEVGRFVQSPPWHTADEISGVFSPAASKSLRGPHTSQRNYRYWVNEFEDLVRAVTESLAALGRLPQYQPASQEAHGFEFPIGLGHFVEPIANSRRMLELEDDWDDEGSPGYQEKTWRVAVSIAVQSATVFLDTHEIVTPAPAIAKGPEGSVDILWTSGTRKVMINVSADEDEPITYHGYDREHASREIKGLLDPADKNEWILGWLTE